MVVTVTIWYSVILVPCQVEIMSCLVILNVCINDREVLY